MTPTPESDAPSQPLHANILLCPWCKQEWKSVLEPRDYQSCPNCHGSFSFATPAIIEASAAPSQPAPAPDALRAAVEREVRRMEEAAVICEGHVPKEWPHSREAGYWRGRADACRIWSQELRRALTPSATGNVTMEEVQPVPFDFDAEDATGEPSGDANGLSKEVARAKRILSAARTHFDGDPCICVEAGLNATCPEQSGEPSDAVGRPDALVSLRANVDGLWGAFEHEIREAVGHTNYTVVRHWLDESAATRPVEPSAARPVAPDGADAVIREAYAVIDELAPEWSGSSIATVLRAFLPEPEYDGGVLRDTVIRDLRAMVDSRKYATTHEQAVFRTAIRLLSARPVEEAEPREPDAYVPDGWSSMTTAQQVEHAAQVLDSHDMLEEADKLRSLYAEPPSESRPAEPSTRDREVSDA